MQPEAVVAGAASGGKGRGQPLAKAVPAASGGMPPRGLSREVWMAHVLIGDGIATNHAAAKRLWAMIEEVPLHERIRFFLILVKC